MAIDPICGMTVDPATAIWIDEHQGEFTYFCCRGCRDRFVALRQSDAPSKMSASSVYQIAPPSPASTELPSCCGSEQAASPSLSKHMPHRDGSRSLGAKYFCPCCPEVEAATPGDCPQCGMPLQPNPAYVQHGSGYVCPMHPQVQSSEPGSCSICGMDLELAVPIASLDAMGERSMRRRTLIAVLFTVPLLVVSMGPMMGLPLPQAWLHRYSGWLQLLLTAPVLLWAGYPLWQRAIRSIANRSPNMFTLVALGTWAAVLLSCVVLFAPSVLPERLTDGHGALYFESAAVIVTLVLLGQWLEILARQRVQTAFAELLALRPSRARLLDGSREIEVPVEQLHVGDRVRVMPGSQVPVDGTIREGTSHLDESMVTGEPEPQSRGVGEPVVAGTINGQGMLIVEVRAEVADSLLARIVSSVALAQRSKAPIQKLADQVSAVFVPVVLLCALIACGAWLFFGAGPERISSAFVAAVSVLLIACPCALGLATPVSIMVGVGRAAREGILIKEGTALQTLAAIDRVVVDKTGTLTVGKMELVATEDYQALGTDDWLAAAAAVEQGSEHPTAHAVILAAKQRNLKLPQAEQIRAWPAQGVFGVIQGKTWRLGRAEWLQREGIEVQESDQLKSHLGSVIHVARDQQLVGTLLLSDRVKPGSASAIASLKKLGIEVEIASGDREPTVRNIAQQVGISKMHWRIDPEGKQQLIRKYQAAGERVAMVGDGINDAPSLAAADVGIAMGTGTDVALETADISLVSGDLRVLVTAIELSRGVMRNIRQNLFFAFAYNAIGIPIAAGLFYPWLGWMLSPMLAAAAMSLSSVSVLANALRLSSMRLSSRGDR